MFLLWWGIYSLCFLCCKKSDAFSMVCIRCGFIWKRKMTATPDLNIASNSGRSCDLAFSFSQIERIDQLFAAGGLRHLIFYYQDVEVAETGIQTWCNVTYKCVAWFIWGWHEAEGHPQSWRGLLRFHLGRWDKWVSVRWGPISIFLSRKGDR